MADYAIRVELRGNPSAATYDTLHQVMRRLGFGQGIDGVTPQGTAQKFALPHAVYYGSSQHSCEVIRDMVLKAVKSYVQQEVLVFVVQTLTWAIGA